MRHPWNQIHHEFAVKAHINRLEQYWQIIFHIRGTIDELLIGNLSKEPVFRDEIWQSNCFEAFVQKPNERSYSEFNFAPNGDWAAYHFDDYRAGMKNLSIAPPKIELTKNNDVLDVIIELDHKAINMDDAVIGLCVILESAQGKSYWAIKHSDDKPDFHQKHCFLYQLEAR